MATFARGRDTLRTLRMYVGGEWIEPASGEYFESYNPFTARPWCRIPKTARMGNPMQTETQVGPVTNLMQYEKVLDYMDVAKNEGVETVLGGNKATRPECGEGWFVEPTIFTGVDNAMRIAQEEVFGPVLSVIPFDDDDHAVAIGNDVVFGLAAGVWTESMRRAINTADRLQAGTVWINTDRALSYMSPFGGYKRSGLGRENGRDAVREYMKTKSVWISS